jgi:hypothetical protein
MTFWPLLSTMDAPFVVKTFAGMSDFLSLFSLLFSFARKTMGYLLKPAIKPLSNWRLPKM